MNRADMIKRDLLRRIEKTYNIDNCATSTFHCGTHFFTPFTESIPSLADYIQVEFDENDEITWWFEDIEDIGLGSMTSATHSVRRVLDTSEKKRKMRHDFVSEAFMNEDYNGKTDISLGEALRPFHNDFDKISPDLYSYFNNTSHFLEITTTVSNDRRHQEAKYEEKQFKYKEALMMNADRGEMTTLTVVVVTPQGIISNINPPRALLEDVAIRFAIGVAVEDAAKLAGRSLITDDYTQELDERVRHLESILSTINVPPGEPISFDNGFVPISVTPRFLQNCLTRTDLDEVALCFKTSMEAARLERETAQHSTVEASVEKFLSSFKEFPEMKREDVGSLINMCLINARVTESDMLPRINRMSGVAPEPLIKVWNAALNMTGMSNFFDEDPKELLREALCSDENFVKLKEESRKRLRGEYHRVKLDVVSDVTVKRYLALDGIGGKKLSKDPDKLLKQARSRKSYKYDTDTKDIDDFINSGPALLEEAPMAPDMEEIISLLDLASDIAGNSRIRPDILKQWCSTKLFQALDIITNIAAELAISIKQNCSSSEYILKKLRYYGVYMLVKPTSSSSHLFVSLYIPQDYRTEVLSSFPFRQVYKCHTGGHVTDFVSFKAHKIGNMLKASSRYITMMAFWFDFYSISSLDINDFKFHSEATKMFYFSMLTSLENKTETEESLTLSRYMYMESFKSNYSYWRGCPEKILSKLTNKPRSRLNLWVIKRLVATSLSLSESPPKKKPFDRSTRDGIDQLPGDQWNGLLNFITGTPISSASAAVNLMYLGYLKDKNENSEANADWGLIEKIVEEEIGVNKSSRENMYGKPEPGLMPDDKGFSLECLKHGCEIMEGKLMSKKGSKWKELLDREIKESLVSACTQEMATLKASSLESHDDINRNSSTDDMLRTVRYKVLEAISCNVSKLGLHPLMAVDEILQEIETSSNGVICDLFKKMQHGGLREIYVLTLESRVLQLFLETISRVICNCFEEETLTHPENKLKLLDEHRIKVSSHAARTDQYVLTYCSSSDKTRWSQGFLMTAMSVPLFRLTDKSLHPSIARIINLWSRKFIKMPPSVTSLLENSTVLSNPIYQELLRSYHNITPAEQAPLMHKPHSPFLRTTSGMMQGILHFTSSLIHLCYLHSSKTIVTDMLKEIYGAHNIQFRMTSVCSSDDSATMLSVLLPKNPNKDSLEVYSTSLKHAEYSLHVLTQFCRFYCMKESFKKSTIACEDYVEFNSEFIFGNTIATPMIKFVAACTNVTESESMLMRSFEMYNLMTSLYESGFPAANSTMCQMGQAVLHYKAMGSATGCLFPYFSKQIKEYPDVSHGFFLLDSELFPGMPGLSYSRWRSVEKFPRLKSTLWKMDSTNVQMGPDGTIFDSLVLAQGDHRKWFSLLDHVANGSMTPKISCMIPIKDKKSFVVDHDVLDEYLSRIESDPHVLYMGAKNIEELKKLLVCKASAPGVSKSLSKGDPTIQSFSSSVHSLYSHSFKRSTLTMVENTKTKVIKKMSLLESLNDRMKASDVYIQDAQWLTMEQSVFPLVERYREISRAIENLRTSVVRTHMLLRQRKTRIALSASVSSVPLSLLQVVKNKWFGHHVPASTGVVNRCFASYKIPFSWLREDVESTLADSPFSSHTELYSFISTQANKTRVIRRTGPYVSEGRLSSQVTGLARRSFLRGCILSSGNSSNLPSIDLELSELSLALELPHPVPRKRATLNCLRRIADLRPTIDDWKDLTEWEYTLGMISLFSQNMITEHDLIDSMRVKKKGLLIVFQKPQTREESADGKVTWTGVGVANIEVDGLKLRAHLKERFVTRIEVENWNKLSGNSGSLRQVYKMLDCRAVDSAEKCNKVNERKLERSHGGSERDIVARFNGSTFCPSSHIGTPIYVVPNLYMSLSDLPPLKVEIHQGSVGLYTDVRRMKMTRKRGKIGEAKYAVLSHKRHLSNIIVSPRCAMETVLWEAWTTMKPLSLSSALNEIVDYRKMMESKEFMTHKESDLTDSIIKWFRESLERRLKSRNLTTPKGCERFWDASFIEGIGAEQVRHRQIPLSEILADLVQEQIDPERKVGFLSLLPSDDNVPMGEEFTLHPGLDSILDIEVKPPLEEGLGLYGVTKEYLLSHPLWDPLINHLIEYRRDYFDALFRGSPTLSQDLIAQTLWAIFGIMPSSEDNPTNKLMEQILREKMSKSASRIQEEAEESEESSSSDEEDVVILERDPCLTTSNVAGFMDYDIDDYIPDD